MHTGWPERRTVPHSLFRYDDGLLRNALAWSEGMGGGLAGVALLSPCSAAQHAIGVSLSAHARVICTCPVHECAHNTLFADKRWNARLGAVLLGTICTAYGRYDDIRHRHFCHRADDVAFDFRQVLPRHRPLLKLIYALVWVYTLALDMMHRLAIVLPLRLDTHRDRRACSLAVPVVRVAPFRLLGVLSPKTLALYVLARLLFPHTMRFMDAHQHACMERCCGHRPFPEACA